MRTPFDALIEHTKKLGYHAHRGQAHSNIVSDGVFQDLLRTCAPLKEDHQEGRIQVWKNIRTPGGRGRLIDLFVGEPDERGQPDLKKLRLGIENKSIITAHRNKGNRFDELAEALEAIQRVKPEAVMIATVLVGVSERVLNIPDIVKRYFDEDETAFNQNLVPRLSKGDSTLWTQYRRGVSVNKPSDALKTVEYFQKRLAARNPALTHEPGYDYVLLVPVHIDNVTPPQLARENTVGIDVDKEYQAMLSLVCKAYTARWHLL